jgi:hypothetical protein
LKHNRSLSDNIKTLDYKKKMHSGVIYYSRLLPTEEVTKMLSQSRSRQVCEQTTSDMESLRISASNLNAQEDLGSEQTAQILQPPYGTPGSS